MNQKFRKLQKHWLIKCLAVGLLAAGSLVADPVRRTPTTSSASASSFVSNEVLVTYRSYVSEQMASSLAQLSAGGGDARVLQHLPRDKGPVVLARLRGLSVGEAIEQISRDPNVEAVQPNYIYHATAAPNDTSYGDLWGLKNTGQTISSPVYASNNPGTAGKDIDAETAWNTITNCSSTVVAVIDGGVNYNHNDLASNMVSGSYTCPGGTGTYGCDFVGTGDNDPMDLNGHGSHVAGTIGARGNNSSGVSGVCWQASILAVRVLNTSGSGTTADIVEGLNFAIGTGVGQGNAKVVNMSLGGPSFDSLFNSALTTAQSNDVVVVVAAGNSTQNHNVTASYPCDYSQDNIICVAAVTQTYALATFSDYDSNSTASNRRVDLGAPGVNVRSTYFGTSTQIADTFNTSGTLNWTNPTSSWTYSTCLGPSMMATPTTWCSATPAPGAFLSSRVYKNFDLSAYNGAYVQYGAWIDLNDSGDSFSFAFNAFGGDPFSGGTVTSYSGAIHTGNFVTLSADISNCTTAACTLGFRYSTGSGSNAGADGVAIAGFSVYGQTVNNTTYSLLNGTSMAAPHVAGIATMVRARNPNFSYTDVLAAIIAGGDAETSMSTTTRYGIVADAAGSLKYIPATTGVSLSVP